MKYKRIKTIKEVLRKHSVQPFDGELFYQVTEGRQVYLIQERDNQIVKKIPLEEEIMDICRSHQKDKYLVVLNTGQGLLFDLNLKPLPLSSSVYYSCRISFGDKIACHRGDLFNSVNGVYSISEQKVLFETEELLGRTIFEDRLYFDLDNIITCRQVETGKLDWEFPLSVYGTYFQNGKDHPMNLRKFLGVYEGVLYIRAGVRLLLGINVSSGKEVFKFTHGKELGGAMFIELDSEKGCIFSLNSTKYNEIDLKTNALSQYDIEEDIEKNKVKVGMLGSCEGGLISFYEGVDCNRFAVFSREEKKVVWTREIEEVKDMFPAIIGMKHSGNKLYVHDIMKTLHIFELE